MPTQWKKFRGIFLVVLLGLAACSHMKFLWTHSFNSPINSSSLSIKGAFLFEDGTAVTVWDSYDYLQFLSRFDKDGKEVWQVELPIHTANRSFGTHLQWRWVNETDRHFYVFVEDHAEPEYISNLFEYDSQGNLVQHTTITGHPLHNHRFNNDLYFQTYDADNYHIYKLGEQGIEWQKSFPRNEYDSLYFSSHENTHLYLRVKDEQGINYLWQLDEAGNVISEDNFGQLAVKYPFVWEGQRYAWLSDSEQSNSGLFKYDDTLGTWERLNNAPINSARFKLSENGLLAMSYSTGTGTEYTGHVNVYDLEGNLIVHSASGSLPSLFTWLEDGRLLYLVNDHTCSETESSYWSQFEFLTMNGDKEIWNVGPVNAYVPNIGYICNGIVKAKSYLVYNYTLTDEGRLLTKGTRFALGSTLGEQDKPFLGLLEKKVQ